MSSSETEYEEIKPKTKTKGAIKDEGVLLKLAEKRKGLVKKHKEEKGYTPQIFPTASAPPPTPTPTPPQPTVNDALAETRFQDLLKKAKDEIRAELAAKPHSQELASKKKPTPKKKKAPVTSEDEEQELASKASKPPPRKTAPPPPPEKLTGSLLLDALFFRK
jgi:hypothetical protein